MDTIRYITDDLSDVDTQELLKCLPNYFEPLGEGPKGVAFLNWRVDKHMVLASPFEAFNSHQHSWWLFAA